MIKNSTLMLIIDEPDGENELVNMDELFDLNGKYSKELDEIFGLFNYSPSEKVIGQILKYTCPK